MLQSVVNVFPLCGAVVREADSLNGACALLTKEGGFALEGVVHLSVCDLASVCVNDTRPGSVDSLDRIVLSRDSTAVLGPFGSYPRRHGAVHVSCLLRDGRLCRLLEQRTVNDGKLGHESGQSDGVEVFARLENGVEAVRVGMVAMQCVQRTPPQCLPPPRDGQTLRDHGEKSQILNLIRNVEQHVGLDGETLKRPVLDPFVVTDPKDGHGHGGSNYHGHEACKARPWELFAPTWLPIDAVIIFIFLLFGEVVYRLGWCVVRLPKAAHRADGPGICAPFNVVLGMHAVGYHVESQDAKVTTDKGAWARALSTSASGTYTGMPISAPISFVRAHLPAMHLSMHELNTLG